MALQGVLCHLEKWLSSLKQGLRYGLKCALLICMDMTYLLPLEIFKGEKNLENKRVEKLAVKSGTFSGLKTFKGENFHATNTLPELASLCVFHTFR